MDIISIQNQSIFYNQNTLDFFDKTHFPASETYGDKSLMDHFALSEVVKALFFFLTSNWHD